MNCRVLRSRLLASADPEELQAGLRAHLADCPSCRAWQRRLVQLERRIPQLPVPPSTAKEAVLRKVRTAPLPWGSGVFGSANMKERGLKKLALATALAAALALFAVGLWHWQFEPRPLGVQTPVPSPLLANLVQRDLRLASAATPRSRLEALADLADDLHGETRPLAGASALDDLTALARLYTLVVRDGIAAQARTLPEEERQAVLGPLSGRLTRAWQTAEQLAREVPDDLAAVLRSMAQAARDGDPLAGALGAADEVPAEPAAERVRQFQRNRGLIQTLVQGALYLAGEDDALKRADHCTGMAETLAVEIRLAAENQEGARAAELGDHLHALLKHGVADNLLTVGVLTPGSSVEKKVQEVQGRTTQALRPLEARLRPEHRAEMQRALRAVVDGRVEVENALRGPPKSDLP